MPDRQATSNRCPNPSHFFQAHRRPHIRRPQRAARTFPHRARPNTSIHGIRHRHLGSCLFGHGKNRLSQNCCFPTRPHRRSSKWSRPMYPPKNRTQRRSKPRSGHSAYPRRQARRRQMRRQTESRPKARLPPQQTLREASLLYAYPFPTTKEDGHIMRPSSSHAFLARKLSSGH